MVKRVLIIGGYGNFGGYIAKALAGDAEIRLLIGGRSAAKAEAFITALAPAHPAEAHAIDIDGDLGEALARIAPDIVIHTTGPFQNQDHRVARACIVQGSHYLDLADARDFVSTIGLLDAEAKARDVLVVSGASSVPCLTAAVIDHYLPGFARLEAVDYGISAAQHTNRGLATTSAVLSYVGKPMTMLRDGAMKTVFGWEDTHAERYPELGWRLFGNCDIPDLTLFPARYPSLRSMRFAAGHELKLLHLATRFLGALVRLGLIGSLAPHAEFLLKLGFLFDRFGFGRSGFHMILTGEGHDGKPRERRFHLIARSGHGPYIPCMPAILLAKLLARGEVAKRGAMPCLDLVDLETYLGALEGLDITVMKEAKMPEVSTAPHSYRDDPAVPSFDDSHALFVFDGICVLCSGGAGWVMRHDKAGKVNFASMQSPLGQALYAHYGVVPDESYLLIANGRAFTASRGYFELCKILGGAWHALRIGTVIPEIGRDWLYALVARNRYRWFGKTEYCGLLTPEQRARLLAE